MMIRTLLAISCIVCGWAYGQGYESPKDIDFEAIRKLSWYAAYRALETKDVQAHLKKKAKSGSDTLVAQVLLFMSDGKSYKKEMEGGFRQFQKSLEALRKQAKTNPEKLAEMIIEQKVMEGALCGAALCHRKDDDAVKFVIRGGGCFEEAIGDAVTGLVYRLAERMGEFAWNWLPQEKALEYLSSDNADLRKGALVMLLGEPIPDDPGATHFYDPAKSPKANRKAIESIRKLFKEDRDYYEKERLKRLEKIKKKYEVKTKQSDKKIQLRAMYEAYKVAKGEEKKRLALQLDELKRVDYRKKFGYPYPGKPLDKSLVRRRLGMRLFVKKMWAQINYERLMPNSKPGTVLTPKADDLSPKQRNLRAELGMKNEAATVAEAWEFLKFVDSVLDGQERELLPVELVWEFCGISYKFHKAKNARTVEEYLKWEAWDDSDMDQRFNEIPEIGKRWGAYMARNYKLNEYIDKNTVVEIHLDRIRSLLATLERRIKDTTEWKKERKRLQEALLVNTPERMASAIKSGHQHMKESSEFLAGARKDSVLFDPVDAAQKKLGTKASAKYVLWKALMTAKSFEEYISLNRIGKEYGVWWPKDKKVVAKYPELYKAYEATLSILVKNHSEYGYLREELKK